MSEKRGIEIERKYVIRMPSVSLMEGEDEYTVSDITQIYLVAPKGETHRKRRIDSISAVETESEIDREWFLALASHPLSGTRPVIKRRHTFRYKEQIFEIDVYPEWQSTAIMETELTDPTARAEMPDFISIVAEVTGDKRYSNAQMSRSFPEELEA